MDECPPPTGQSQKARDVVVHLPRGSPLGTLHCPLKASPSDLPSRPLLHAAPGTGAHGESWAPHRLPANEKIPPLSVSRTRPPETDPFVSSVSPAAAMRRRPTRDPGEARLPKRITRLLARSREASRGNTKNRLRQQLLSLWEAPEESAVSPPGTDKRKKKSPQLKVPNRLHLLFVDCSVCSVLSLFNQGHPTTPRSLPVPAVPSHTCSLHDSSQLGLLFEPNVQPASWPLATGPCGHRRRVWAAAGCPAPGGSSLASETEGSGLHQPEGLAAPTSGRAPSSPWAHNGPAKLPAAASAQVLMDQLVLPSQQALASSKFCSCQPSLLS
ncbi:uncharacterized protein LOC117014585 [Rhinolophus ferrumequinum]|uniref:uncharacterized protein LOC117014585 n=1 Tax=Rhinolophus ferrumequinum TaxID=59479 RepID=UPI00140FE383|nr:uncharacterized protein LOC117014585 [Rhinolophus ferrumequinum]